MASEDDCEDKICLDDAFNESKNAFSAENSVSDGHSDGEKVAGTGEAVDVGTEEARVNGAPPEPFFPWKLELESLVHDMISIVAITVFVNIIITSVLKYMQAMNFFAGLLLLLMPEENAFWTLVGIIDDYFDGYYTEEMTESQVDQLVFEELVGWIIGPWFLSIFVNMIPWGSVIRVWDVLLFEGNRVMLFRTALALMELYGPALVTTKDAGDAITLLQSLAGSTFDSSQLVLTACMGFLAATESRLKELRDKHRPAVLAIVEERFKQGQAWKDSKGLASKLYSFKCDPSIIEEKGPTEEGSTDRDVSRSKYGSCNLDEFLSGLSVSEVDSLPDIQDQVDWLKVEECRVLEEKRSAVLIVAPALSRAKELETALMEIVELDNRRELSARVLMWMEQEQKVTEDAQLRAKQEAAAQKSAVNVLQVITCSSRTEMEKRVKVAESMLEATLQYESGKHHNKDGHSIIWTGWHDRNKGCSDLKSLNQRREPSSPKEKTGEEGKDQFWPLLMISSSLSASRNILSLFIGFRKPNKNNCNSRLSSINGSEPEMMKPFLSHLPRLHSLYALPRLRSLYSL
ncbi:unnamed protein product [Malus baccata var. baccata]